MPSDIKERVVARNVKTLDRAALLQKAARPAALRVGETAKAANPAHTRERRGDEAEGGWAAARGESERTAHEGFAATANGARVAPRNPAAQCPQGTRAHDLPVRRARRTSHAEGLRGILRVKPRSIEPFAEGAPAGERARPRSHAHEGAGGVARTRGPGIPQSYGEGRERRRAAGGKQRGPVRAHGRAPGAGGNCGAHRSWVVRCRSGRGDMPRGVRRHLGVRHLPHGRRHRRRQPPLREVVAEIDAEHAAKVEEAKASADATRFRFRAARARGRKPSPCSRSSWRQTPRTRLDVLTLDAARQGALRAVFWDMNSIETEIEEAEPSDSDGEDAPPAKVLRVTLSAKTADRWRRPTGSTRGNSKRCASFWTSATTPHGGPYSTGSRAAPLFPLR